MSQTAQLPGANDLNEFDSMFGKVIEFAKSSFNKGDEEVRDRFEELLKYNLSGGKKYRGLFVVKCFKELNLNCTGEQLENAQLIGWCVELFQSFFLIHDDLMDNSLTRRGRPCWFKKENVGLIAINDAIYLQNLNFEILKKNFSNFECYVQLVNLFLEMYRNTVIGQCFDLISNPPGKTEIDYNLFTIERYRKIITYKTAYYTFSLPIRAALYLSGIKDAKIHNQVEEIMLMIGQLFQIQDDYLDLYGDPKITGKIGSDMIEGKCCWLITTALQLADEQQLNIIKDNYGKEDIQCVDKMKKLYEQLRLKQVFLNLEENSYRQLNQKIIKLSKETNLPELAFSFCLKGIYRRIK